MSRKLTTNQSGLVSIMVTLIMIMVISLIVLGFAQITRRNQRESLDNQLSSQAYYAAESGVNDAIPVLQSAALASTPLSTTDCNAFTNSYLPAGKTKQLNSDGSVAYSCLLVNNEPPSLQWGDISNGRAIATPLNTTATLKTLNLSWKASDSSQLDAATCANGNQLPPNTTATGGWKCSYGLLRLDLMQDNGATSAAAAANSTITFFLKPSTTTTAYSLGDFGQSAKGVLLRTKCATGSCTAAITLTGGAQGKKYYARISAVYRDLHDVTLTGQSPSVGFAGSQAVIDSTGKAQDVLRRIQVHVPLIANANQVSAGLQTTGSICKLILVTGSSASSTCTSGPTTGGTPAGPTACTAAHDIVLVLDSSSSMTSQWETLSREQELEKVADTFIDSTGVSPAGNNVAIVSFNQTAKTTIGYSSDVAALKNAIAHPFNGVGTGYVAGLDQAKNIFNNSGRPAVQKVAIFISDGRPDTDSQSEIFKVTDAMKHKDSVLIYAIGIDDVGSIDTSILSNMASDPQSTYYTAASKQTDFEKFFAGISSEVIC